MQYRNRPTIETVERRICLSVTASVDDGDLIVSGDADGVVQVVAMGGGSYQVIDDGNIVADTDVLQGVDDTVIISDDGVVDGNLYARLGGGGENGNAVTLTGVVQGSFAVVSFGDVDLLVTYEWGPVRLFRNDEGHLVDATQEAGLAERLGWWNGISGCDVDHDGDIDYAVTNFGLNTKYHANSDHPVMVYYGDFEGNGEYQIVEAADEGDTVWPVRGRSCSSNAMPELADRFKTFHEFALADLAEIYTPQCLEQSLKLDANELRSGLLLNDGAGRFTFRALPALAQVSPGFGVAFCYADGDVHPDLYVVQNFFGPQRETGRMDGGLSVLLLGDGQGGFQPVWPARSGLIVPTDAKGLATISSNDRGAQDFVVSVNNDRFRTFRASAVAGRSWQLRLRGPAGNPTAVGAKVRVATTVQGQSVRVIAEVYAGGSYLSQSSPWLSMPVGDESTADVVIVWPDGTKERSKFTADADGVVELSHQSLRGGKALSMRRISE